MSTCKQCQQQFNIDAQDKEFYQKLNVPEPTLCPDCRFQRRLLYRNERNLYQRKCSISGKNIISVYPSKVPWPVYDTDEWFSDKWTATTYAQNYDENKSFFQQLKELQAKVPRPALAAILNENSPYINQCWRSKNLYMAFDAGYCENSMYCGVVYYDKEIMDCFATYKSELSYYLIDCINCFECQYCQDCRDCHDAYFSYDCRGCSRVAFCSNLRNQTNYLFNKQVDPEEFDKFLNKLQTGSYKLYQEYAKKWQTEIIAKAIHKFNHNANTENCSGDYLLNSKNCKDSFVADRCEDIRYCNNMDEKINNAYDLSFCSIAEVVYEGTILTGHNLKFCANIWDYSTNLEYCDLCMACNDCLGCIGLNHKKYCILNKEYSKEEYFKLKERIIREMKLNQEYGEFFPINLAPFPYNRTLAQDFFPLTKEQCVKNNWQWEEEDTGSYGKENINNENIPDLINNIADDFVHRVLKCDKCAKNYKIIVQELAFYKQHHLPIPHQCFFCRDSQRRGYRNPYKLKQRNCSKCHKEIITTYPENFTGLVYCEECYNKEIY